MKTQKADYWSAPTSQVNSDDFKRVPKLSIILICSTFAALAAGVFWSSQANIVEVAIAQGRVIPVSKVQLVQNLEGGIINEIHISEGERVKKGEILVQIDPTSTDSSLGERREHIASLRANRKWLSALLNGSKPEFEAEFKSEFPELVERGLSQFSSRTSELKAQKATLDEQITQKQFDLKSSKARLINLRLQLKNATEQFVMHTKLYKQRASSRSEVLSAETRVLELQASIGELENLIPGLEAGISEIENKHIEIEARFRSEMTEKLNDVSVKLNALKSADLADQDRIERTNVRSPVNGIVKILHTNTVGQIVKPGENIVEIVPIGENLLVQTNVTPTDIAFIYPDQPAVIKITAYDSAIYGNLKGSVKRIAADSIIDENGNAFYKVDVQAEASHLERNGQIFPIIPGMVAQVDIVTGEKTVLDYITKPIHRTASSAFRER